MERNSRTTFQGVVTSTKNDMTITVVIEWRAAQCPRPSASA